MKNFLKQIFSFILPVTVLVLVPLWIEEDYCNPPLAMERESVIDRYFEDITV